MSATRIFVSSTCYDLKPIRESIRDCIRSLGHEALLSEYASFPVRPDDDTLSNCRKNIEEHTDLLVLIVGGRRGSLDEDSGKSITSLEYQTARAAGIPCFVFVDRTVQTLLHVWRKNPDADFSPTVDYLAVFEFIEQIQKENTWTFPFDQTAEITDTLRGQLSNLLRDLLSRSRKGSLCPVPGFENETAEAQRLARDKPDYWEYLLAGELLDSKLQPVVSEYQRVLSRRTHRVAERIKDVENSPEWACYKFDDACRLIEAFKNQLPCIVESFGEPGEKGDSKEILRAVNEWIELCERVVEWEADLQAVHLPEVMADVQAALCGMMSLVIEEIQRLPKALKEPFADGKTPSGVINIQLVFEIPDMKPFDKALKIAEKKVRKKGFFF